MRRQHHSPRESTRRTHASLGPGSNPSVSHFRWKRRRLQICILQGELKNIKLQTLNGEHRKEEEVEALLLEMKKYF
jgi:hypothetical protein